MAQLRVVVVLVITTVCLVAALWGIDLSVAGQTVIDARWSQLVWIIPVYYGTHVLRVWRMQALLDRHVRFGQVLSILSVGYLAIHVVPFRMGEFVRPYLLSERAGMPFASGLAAILVERLLDMMMLLGLLVSVAWLVELPPSGIVVQGIDVLAAGQKLAGTLVLIGIGGLIAVLGLGERLLRLTDRLPGGRIARSLYAGFSAVPRHPARIGGLLLISAAIWLVTILGVWLCLNAFEGLPTAFSAAYVIWTVVLAGTSAVPTPGFFGVFEASCVAAVLLYGGEPHLAQTFAVVLHLSQFGFTAFNGVLFLFWEGLSLRQLVGASRVQAGA